MYIIGAGYTGLIAATIFPTATVIESRPKPFEQHQALLRFRSSHIGDLTHIPFQPVTVHKAIWFQGREVSPAPRFSNLYSKKVTGKFLPRSINDVSPVTRYIAPANFYEQLLERVGERILWASRVEAITKEHISGPDLLLSRQGSPVISTIPLGNMCRATGIGLRAHFSFEAISTYRSGISRDSSVFCTVYYPDPDFPFYRASITKNLVILEAMGKSLKGVDDRYFLEAFESLGIDTCDMYEQDEAIGTQKYGKISPIDNRARKRAIFTMTNEFGIFSLGRFGTWRNILLDDVYFDILKIREMINMEDYELKGLQL